MPIPIIDVHLDLAWNAVSFNRDLTLEVGAIRERERGMTDEPSRGKNTVTLPELRRAEIPLCVATLLARGGPEQKAVAGYKRTDLDHATQPIAYAAARGQLAYYQLLERQGHLRFIRTKGELEEHWNEYERGARSEGRASGADPRTGPHPGPLPEYREREKRAALGIVLSMEGADPIVEPEQLEEWYAVGLRAVGPAHYGRSHYAYGTAVCGPLSAMGVELLRRMEKLAMILDVTHLCDESMAQALDLFGGHVWASHHNCRALVPGDRQLTDEQIERLVARGAVIGVALDAWMLYPGWVRGETRPEVVSLEAVADHIDRVCQIAGSARHSCIGSDLDGGFGTEQTPRDLGTIADLQKLAGILEGRGYSAEEVRGIFYGNGLGFLRRALPDA